MKCSGKKGFYSITLFVFLLFGLFCGGAHGALYYVREGGAGDGSSWENALGEEGFINTLETALADDAFWVAAGTYRPTTDPGDRNASFVLKSGVALFGGFAGTEDRREDRDWTVHIAILTGEIQNDGSAVNNSRHILIASDTDRTAVLDGFTIEGGNADGGGGSIRNGGGMYSENGSPIITNCTFSNNSCDGMGAAMYSWLGRPLVTNCSFLDNNVVGGKGGGMCNSGSDAEVEDCTFIGNGGGEGGGGMHNLDCAPSVTACTFDDNWAFSGAAMNNFNSPATVTNCTFNENTAESRGGGMRNWRSDVQISNCTFRGNAAPEGSGIANGESSPTVTNCIFWSASPVEIINYAISAPMFSYCIVRGGYPGGTSILDVDPLLGELADNGGPTMTCALLTGSPAIDAGTSAGMPAEDQRGIARPQGSGFDMGAFEFVISAAPPVSSGGGGCSAAGGPASISLIFPVLLLASIRSRTFGKNARGRPTGKEEHNSRA